MRWVRTNEDEGSIEALVTSWGKTIQHYKVSISIRNGQVRGHNCDCHDHGRQGACKHVLAVAGVEILRIRADWKKLKGALVALTGEDDD